MATNRLTGYVTSVKPGDKLTLTLPTATTGAVLLGTRGRSVTPIHATLVRIGPADRSC